MKAQSAIARRQSGSAMISDPRPPLMIWIGAWSGGVGVAVYNLAQPAGMLPINRILLATDATLMIAWFLILLLVRPGRRP